MDEAGRIIGQQTEDTLLGLPLGPVGHHRLDNFKGIVLGIQIIQALIELEDVAQ